MFDECFYCPAAERCSMSGNQDECDELLTRVLDESRDAFNKAWEEYVGEDADY